MEAGAFQIPTVKYRQSVLSVSLGDVFGLGLQWHCPNEEENQFAQELFDLFVVPELEELDSFSDEKSTLKREHLQRSLNLILQTMQGLACALPQWDGLTIQPLPSKVWVFMN